MEILPSKWKKQTVPALGERRKKQLRAFPSVGNSNKKQKAAAGKEPAGRLIQQKD